MSNTIITKQVNREESAFLFPEELVVEQLPSHLLEKISDREESTINLKNQKVSVLREIDVKLTNSRLYNSNFVKFTAGVVYFSVIAFFAFSASVIISNPIITLLLFSGAFLVILQPILHLLFHEFSLTTPSSLGPLEFLNVKETYYKKMEKALSLSLDRLSKPTEEESQKLLNKVHSVFHNSEPYLIFSNNKNIVSCYSSKSEKIDELISSFDVLSRTKTGYFVLNQALQSNELMILDRSDQSMCISTDHRRGGGIKWILSKIFSSLFIFDWKIHNSNLKFSEYAPKFKYRNFKINIANPKEILCMENNGKIVGVKKQSVALTLLHELAHTLSENSLGESLQELPSLEQMDDSEEFKAIMFENMLLKELGFTCRRVAHWSPNCWSDILRELQYKNLEEIETKKIDI